MGPFSSYGNALADHHEIRYLTDLPINRSKTFNFLFLRLYFNLVLCTLLPIKTIKNVFVFVKTM